MRENGLQHFTNIVKGSHASKRGQVTLKFEETISMKY